MQTRFRNDISFQFLTKRSMSGHESSKVEACVWLRSTWRAVVAEIVATALMVSLNIAAGLPRKGPNGTLMTPPLEHPAFTVGLVVLANIEVFGFASGAHMNPSVTLAAVLSGRMTVPTSIVYICSQMFGAMLGFFALTKLSPIAAISPTGCNVPCSEISGIQAAFIEALLTTPLILLNCVLWTKHDNGLEDNLISMKIGFTVIGLTYAGGYLTGASLNPARSLAPAIYHLHFDYLWVYWLGPLTSAVLATLLYQKLFIPTLRPKRQPNEVPLNEHKKTYLKELMEQTMGKTL